MMMMMKLMERRNNHISTVSCVAPTSWARSHSPLPPASVTVAAPNVACCHARDSPAEISPAPPVALRYWHRRPHHDHHLAATTAHLHC
ncbi:hypothetical protein BDV40DRAFT_260406 [Aspergillus tamarii]|uniref:Uncharacterized protein n=1 Tax=Aspergillus tamarii TaxID=41984 RepID=A0A5N6V0V4_ASPTM|nr:hypothetical protein BDV40DRAFT_260406 [Aspergillus tamarii]